MGALDVAQRVFDRVSFDLIYARPDQSLGDWHAELTRALAFGTEHLSLYQLTVEPGTRFATEEREGRLVLPDTDRAADLFELTRETTARAGLPAYEISNHARPGAESRHNLTYWRYGDYAGIGPGAHGRRGGFATQRRRKPENWIEAVARNGHGIEIEDRLTPGERATEAMLMGLRLAEGIDLDADRDARRTADRDARRYARDRAARRSRTGRARRHPAARDRRRHAGAQCDPGEIVACARRREQKKLAM